MLTELLSIEQEPPKMVNITPLIGLAILATNQSINFVPVFVCAHALARMMHKAMLDIWVP